ncbi:MAG: hypothetical protein JO131_04065, partial [Gammaproteobacteria bacterium]|nr:hypothetical protein [Gammaproteobacteria bacterium]
MRNKNVFLLLKIFALLWMTSSQASTPLWTFTPLTPTTISVPANSSANVQYQITNQSTQLHTLLMQDIIGVTQITTGAGICTNPFVLTAHNSCILSLKIDGSKISSGNTNGPVVCEQGNILQCYKPSPSDTLNVNVTSGQYSVGGAISGLVNTLYLQNNGIDLTAFNNNGSFVFSTPLLNGTSYNVTVASQPTNQTCSVANGTGIVNSANVTNVTVTCATNAYTVGGTVSGLSGTLVLLNNGSDTNTITSDGNFVFLTPIAEGSSYNVTVATQPSGQTCTVTNGSGTMGSNNITNVAINCLANSTTLAASLSHLALATNGNARTITITNTGSITAKNVSISYPTFPSGTTVSSTCNNSLSANDACVITVMPGANATSNCNSPYSSPMAGTITVNASNITSPISTDVVVLSYGCVYEKGYLFAIDDTTPSNTSIGGTVAAMTDSADIQWYNGIRVVTNAQSLTNGLNCLEDSSGNTCNIINTQGSGSYAAQTCSNYAVDSSGNTPCSTGICYDHWYLPAICQIGHMGEGAGCASGIENIVTNLPALISGCTGPSCLEGVYWSSTEYSSDPLNDAWLEILMPGSSIQTNS